eukprot:CAMPEP_0194437662 /NCGR_PEP_ID=MMETSP0176-20130528/101145_1 /TAXON_ID=216777 /ORGANISM="Proboscia alata, Strain PI-D3" /LENGTH=135 /DNA_ID=CAMNT_0039259129 /DNA_START=326 /DNA_END=731 /DNA_ORIENTATION=-
MTMLGQQQRLELKEPVKNSSGDQELNRVAVVCLFETLSTEKAGVGKRYGVNLGINIGMRWKRARQLLRKILTTSSEYGMVNASLTLCFRQWPQDWQRGGRHGVQNGSMYSIAHHHWVKRGRKAERSESASASVSL